MMLPKGTALAKLLWSADQESYRYRRIEMHIHTDLQRHSLSRMIECLHAMPKQKRLKRKSTLRRTKKDEKALILFGQSTTPSFTTPRTSNSPTLFQSSSVRGLNSECLVVFGSKKLLFLASLTPLPVNMEAWDKMP